MKEKVKKFIVPEASLKQLDRQATGIEYQSAISQWAEWDVLWGVLYPNNKFETFDIYTELTDLDMKVLLNSAKNTVRVMTYVLFSYH